MLCTINKYNVANIAENYLKMYLPKQIQIKP